MSNQSDVASWYSGKSIFITGATGFMGKILIEKLLRSCPDIGKIYVLIREKKERKSSERIKELLESNIFDDLRNKGVRLTERLYPISGDISCDNLGLSQKDRQLLEEFVTVVFHMAATVKFDEPLRLSVKMNVAGTKALLELCRGMKKLTAVVHVSTAFANCDRSAIEERIYPPPADSDKIIQCVANLDDDSLNFLTPRLIKNRPNTYTFTKALGEHVVANYSSKLPIVIVRPSIVSASWKEPRAGWVDNLNGPAGLMVGAGKGLLRSVYSKKEMIADLIPVDICINVIIIAAWHIGSGKKRDYGLNIPVYNCVSSPFKKISWDSFTTYLNSALNENTMCNTFLIPHVQLTNNRLKHTIVTTVLEATAMWIADFFAWITVNKQIYRRMHAKVEKSVKVLEYFVTHEWKFDGMNVKRLGQSLTPVDREIFYFDISSMNWKEYVTNYFLGIRKYILKEDNSTIPAARRKVTLIRTIFTALKLGTLAVCACFTLDYCNFRNLQHYIQLPSYLHEILDNTWTSLSAIGKSQEIYFP